jgi:hypothetical protein
MREVGCEEAMNFDGGGSSTLYVQNLGVRNVPSEGTERTVTNGVYLVSKTPEDKEIAEIRYVDWVKEVPKYGYYTPKFYGYNKYGVLVDTDLQGVTLSCGADLGEIVDNGTTLSASGSGSHILTADYKGITTELVVRVETTTPRFRLSGITLDSPGEYQVEILSTLNGEEVSLNGRCFTWTSENNTVATVEENGLIKVLSPGTSVVRGTVGDYVGELTVNLEIPKSRYRSVDYGLDKETWSLYSENVSEEVSSVELLEDNGYALNFTPTATRKVIVGMSNDISSWSRPDSIVMEINPVTPTIRYVYLSLEDQTRPDELIEYKYQVSGLKSGEYSRISIPMSAIIDTTDIGSYPLKLKGIKFGFLTVTQSNHRIELRNINWAYSSVPEASGVENVAMGESALKLAPNPVEAGAVVKLGVAEAVKYTITALNGAVVAQGEGVEFSTEGLVAGVYVVKVNGGASGKLIIK